MAYIRSGGDKKPLNINPNLQRTYPFRMPSQNNRFSGGIPVHKYKKIKLSVDINGYDVFVNFWGNQGNRIGDNITVNPRPTTSTWVELDIPEGAYAMGSSSTYASDVTFVYYALFT